MHRLLLLTAALLLCGAAQARDTMHTYSIDDVFENPEYADRVKEVQFHFMGAPEPAVAEDLGTFQANKKTNAFGKSDNEACGWAFLSALLSLQERALAEGGNAVVNIYSYYKKRRFESADQYQCGAGAIMAGVTLKGTVVRLQD